MDEFEKRASDLGMSPEALKLASVLEGCAIVGFADELDRIVKFSEENGKKENGKEKNLPPFIKKKMEEKEEKNGDDKEKKNGDKKDEKKEDKKEEKKEEKKESSVYADAFNIGFNEALKESGLGSKIQSAAPWVAGVLGLAGIGTGMHAIKKQKEATEITRGGVMRGFGQLAAQQRHNTMRDMYNESRLAQGMNQNRAALLSMIKKQGGK